MSGAVDRQTDCPDTGCGPSLDPLLNKQKNIKDLSDPVDGFEIGDNREKLQELGEGKRIVVVANALAVRKGGAQLYLSVFYWLKGFHDSKIKNSPLSAVPGGFSTLEMVRAHKENCWDNFGGKACRVPEQPFPAEEFQLG